MNLADTMYNPGLVTLLWREREEIIYLRDLMNTEHTPHTGSRHAINGQAHGTIAFVLRINQPLQQGWSFVQEILAKHCFQSYIGDER